MTTNLVYRGCNSPFLVTLKDILDATFTATSMAAITRVVLKYIPSSGAASESADSDTPAHADVFDWTTYANDGKLLIDLGLLDFTVGRDTAVELKVYDATYTSGRVQADLLDIEVSDAFEDTGSGVDPLPSVFAPLTVTDNYQVLLADLSRSSIRVNAATLKTMTMPAMTAAYDGKKVSFIIQGEGDVKLLRNGTQTMINGTHVSITGTQRYGRITLEWIDAITTWGVCDPVGHWEGGAA